MEKIETINFHEVKEVAGIKFWCYHAGHVLGAAMFMIEIAGVKVRSLFLFLIFTHHHHTNCVCVRALVVVHRRFFPSRGSAPDGSRDSQCETRYSDHCEINADLTQTSNFLTDVACLFTCSPVYTLGVYLWDSHP